MGLFFHYDMSLPEKPDNIVQEDFYLFDGVSSLMLRNLADPIKFSSTTSILVKKGSCKADINLISYEIKAPAIVTIHSTQILQLQSFSDDFEASFLVLSKRFVDSVFVLLSDNRFFINAGRRAVWQIPEDKLQIISGFNKDLLSLINDTSNPNKFEAFLFQLAAFFCRIGHHLFPDKDENPKYASQGRITGKFLSMAQLNFKKERYLEFYANRLDITPKHLSRTVKAQTGYTAVEWIERFVILEAQGMLKSTNMNIQQISDELNFSSQSFFGKFFKKHVGITPKEFRNRR